MKYKLRKFAKSEKFSTRKRLEHSRRPWTSSVGCGNNGRSMYDMISSMDEVRKIQTEWGTVGSPHNRNSAKIAKAILSIQFPQGSLHATFMFFGRLHKHRLHEYYHKKYFRDSCLPAATDKD